MPLLFSYGTLQFPKVQKETFGRYLVGREDKLVGYELRQVEITDPDVLKKSEEKFHPIAIPSNNGEDRVAGQVFELSDAELADADRYEVDDYKRISVTLESGVQAWLYVVAKNEA
ncbi:gamma-glutamyl AIG2-like cyclotransferase [Litorimonas taeanensis]|uniref:Gamma-glutamyl AIG2-like cyclotransferase n=1 Tax=Litorimonas taeanensis TaxID=568099 RepID=A0A420WLM0_9PROT|nr:gamma-glutamylcyclotransferase family protein [Litorimonas taeanensis]RKQ71775.1 gamma-glutamyl AIG2-like cyclotransferase [Litorimonas taeanensis]